MANIVNQAFLLPLANPAGFTPSDEGVVGLDSYGGLPATYKHGRGFVPQAHWAWEMNTAPPGGNNWGSNDAFTNSTTYGASNPVTMSVHGNDGAADWWWSPTFDPARTGTNLYQSSPGNVLMPATGGTMIIHGTFNVALEVWGKSPPATDITITAFLEGCRTSDGVAAAEIWRDQVIWPGGTQSINTFADLTAQFHVLGRQNGVPGSVSNVRAPRLYLKTSQSGSQGGIKALKFQLRGYLFPQRAARTIQILSNPSGTP